MDSQLTDAFAALAISNYRPFSASDFSWNAEDTMHWESHRHYLPISADAIECRNGLDERYGIPASRGGRYIGLKELTQLYTLGLGNLAHRFVGMGDQRANLQLYPHSLPKGLCFYYNGQRYILTEDLPLSSLSNLRNKVRNFANNPCELSTSDIDKQWAMNYDTRNPSVLPLEESTGIYPLLSISVASPQFISFDGTITALCSFPDTYPYTAPITLTGALCGNGRCQIIASSYADLPTNEEHRDSYIILTSLCGNGEEELYGVDEAAPMHMAYAPIAPNQTLYIYAFYQNGRPDIRFCEIRPPHLNTAISDSKWKNVTFTALGGMGVVATPQWPSILNR